MIKPFKLGLAFGIGSAIFMLLYGILALVGVSGFDTGYALIGQLYPGITLDVLGLLFAVIWAFVEGLVWGWLVFTIYKLLKGHVVKVEPKPKKNNNKKKK